MDKRTGAKSVIAFIIITILAAAVIFAGVYMTVFGISVQTTGEPTQLWSKAVYPNLDGEGQPISYSAVVYDAGITISRGSAAAYLSEESEADCRLSTAYYYGRTEDGYTLYDEETGEYFEIEKGALRGKAVVKIPYIGALFSFCATSAGMVFFAAFSLVMFVLWAIYLAGFIKKCRKPARAEQKACGEMTAEETETVDAPQAQDEAAEDIDDEAASTENDDAEETDSDAEVAVEAETASEEITAETETDESDDISDETVDAEVAVLDELTADIKAKGDMAYIHVCGSVEKVTKLERAIAALKEKKTMDISVEPCDAEPAGSEITCGKDILPVVAALIDRINN